VTRGRFVSKYREHIIIIIIIIIPGGKFSTLVQTDPEAHPASYTMGTMSFPRVERLGRDADHLPPSIAEVKERIEVYLYSPSGPSWPVIG
jgi:hypothetical protein